MKKELVKLIPFYQKGTKMKKRAFSHRGPLALQIYLPNLSNLKCNIPHFSCLNIFIKSSSTPNVVSARDNSNLLATLKT